VTGLGTPTANLIFDLVAWNGTLNTSRNKIVTNSAVGKISLINWMEKIGHNNNVYQ